MGALDYRITDTQVRRNDALMKIAMEFIDEYDGEFEPLLLVQHSLRQNRGLTIVQARLVLNCLRQEADPFWAPLQQQLAFALDVPDRVRKPKLRVVPKPERDPRPWQIRTPAALHHDMVSPKPRNGAIHKPIDTQVWWDLPTNGRGSTILTPGINRVPTLVVYVACGTYYSNPIAFSDDALYSDRNFCRSGCWEED